MRPTIHAPQRVVKDSGVVFAQQRRRTVQPHAAAREQDGIAHGRDESRERMLHLLHHAASLHMRILLSSLPVTMHAQHRGNPFFHIGYIGIGRHPDIGQRDMRTFQEQLTETDPDVDDLFPRLSVAVIDTR